MKCPYCASVVNKVVDKRDVQSLGEIRRRRQCLKCSRRFTTYEKMVSLELVVIKKDGRRETFIREKLRNGIARSLEKRVEVDKVDEMVDKIERLLRRKNKQEITSKMIGQTVLKELKRVDTIAYLRFASVYRHFADPEDFAKEITSLGVAKS